MTTLAARFRALHQSGRLLTLPNAWDAMSARITEAAGATAIATSSAAMAWAHGYPDGERLPLPVLLATVREIVARVQVPVSVDFEAGFAADPQDNVAAVIDAGAVGVNLEDGAGTPEEHCRRIAAARRAAVRTGVPLFINARTDVYLKKLVPPEQAVAEVLARAKRYQEAGADGLFVPGVVAQRDIEALARGSAMPLNVMAMKELAPVQQLQAWGVRRLSAGSSLCGATLAFIRRAATEMVTQGTLQTVFAEVVPWAEVNALLK